MDEINELPLLLFKKMNVNQPGSQKPRTGWHLNDNSSARSNANVRIISEPPPDARLTMQIPCLLKLNKYPRCTRRA